MSRKRRNAHAACRLNTPSQIPRRTSLTKSPNERASERSDTHQADHANPLHPAPKPKNIPKRRQEPTRSHEELHQKRFILRSHLLLFSSLAPSYLDPSNPSKRPHLRQFYTARFWEIILQVMKLMSKPSKGIKPFLQDAI